MSEEKKPENEIRIRFNSKTKDIIQECEKLIKEGKVKDIHLSAVSNTIADLIFSVEILKSMYPNLIQQNKFSTIPPRSNDNSKKKDDKPQKLFPRLEIILTISNEEVKKEGAISTITEEERKILIETLDKRKDAFKKKKAKRPFRNIYRRSRSRSRTNRRNVRRTRYSFSAKRTGFNWRKPSYNNRRPYGRRPEEKKMKFNEPRKISGNRQVATKN